MDPAYTAIDAALSKIRVQDIPLWDARKSAFLKGKLHLFVVKIGVTIKRLTIALLKLC